MGGAEGRITIGKKVVPTGVQKGIPRIVIRKPQMIDNVGALTFPRTPLVVSTGPPLA